jgi:hypothetical protein
MDDKCKSDAPANDLLLCLTKKMRQEDACFTPVHEFNELNQRRKFSGAFISDMTLTRGGNRLLEAFVHNYGKGPFCNADSYFPKSYELMWSYIEGPDAVKEYHDELKAKFQTTYDKVIREVEPFSKKRRF